MLVPSASRQEILGIAIRQQIYEYPEATDANGTGYQDKRELDALIEGEIWVWYEDAVTLGDQVYYRHTAGTSPNDLVGRFRATADGTSTGVLSNARWLTSTAVSGLARLAIDLT